MSYIVNQAGLQYIAEFLADTLKGDYTAADLAGQPFARECASRAESDATEDGAMFEVRGHDTISGRPEICSLGAEHLTYVADEA